jgi:hypothetical protein
MSNGYLADELEGNPISSYDSDESGWESEEEST